MKVFTSSVWQLVDRRGEDSRLEQVPVVGEGARHGTQIVQPHPAGHRKQQGRGDARVVEQLGAQRDPAVVEGDPGGDLIEHLDQRREAGLHRMLAEDALREGVQGADRGCVEVVQRFGRTLGALGADVGGGERVLERSPKPVAQLGAGLLGEGDGGDVPQRYGRVLRPAQSPRPGRSASGSCLSRRLPRRTASGPGAR